MSSLLRFALATVLALPTLAHSVGALASSGANASARVRLWDDVDHDGVLGSSGDALRAEALTYDGSFALAATGCTRCAVVIDQARGMDGAWAPAVEVRLDGVARTTLGGALWRDDDRNGALGGAADVLVGTATATGGRLAAPGPLCAACGLVVVDWVGSGQDIDWIGSGQDIDRITGAIPDWGGSSQDIDWGGAGDEIDWGGAGDEVDWGGSGDEVDWGGAGDEIDWGGAGDEIDWGGSGDEIDAGAAGR